MLLETVKSTAKIQTPDCLKLTKICKTLTSKNIINKKKLYFQGKIAENKNNPKELWRILKYLSMPSKGGRQSKMPLKENGVVFFDPKKNATFFVGFSQT